MWGLEKMHLTCTYTEGRGSWDRIVAPTSAPNKGNFSEILPSSRDVTGSNRLRVPSCCINKKAEVTSFLFPHREASALQMLLLELQFGGCWFNPALYFSFVPSTGEQDTFKYHGWGLIKLGTFVICAPARKTSSPEEANGMSRCFCRAKAQIFTANQKSLHEIYGHQGGNRSWTRGIHLSP